MLPVNSVPDFNNLKSLKYKIWPYYLLRPRLWMENVRPIDRRVALSWKWSYAYIRIPKAANSSIIISLQTYLPEFEMSLDTSGEIKKQYGSFRDLSFRQALFSLPGFFMFSMVRNPYHRVLSAYLSKIKKPDNSVGRRHLADILPYDDGRNSFHAFCRYLADGGERENAHWMRQTRILSTCDRLDYIGHVESLEQDLTEIVHRIRGDARDPKSKLKSARQGSATHASEQARSWYDDECRQIVEQVYGKDFIELNYLKGEF